jgi:hypothetical protein
LLGVKAIRSVRRPTYHASVRTEPLAPG